ncbi:hypothetical protein NDU88_008763 [Pleurodeles waltl]|uniref:Uncharacterized protein n=1 Tax=Pleurodeles waltl TaxID=8319 RepID=A0AAV7RVQ1_PLEWA|nr:hypothetical protein NDU88_008763 [Pleurodeles waltl]
MDFAIRIGEAETCMLKLEDDTAIEGEIRESLRSQMGDTQWKTAYLENRAIKIIFVSSASQRGRKGQFLDVHS